MLKLSATSRMKSKLSEAYKSWAKADEEDMQENNRFIERMYEVLNDLIIEVEKIDKTAKEKE